MKNHQDSFGSQILLGDQAVLLKEAAPLEDMIIVHGDPARFAAFTSIPALESAFAVMDAWDGTPRTARAWSPANGPVFQIFAIREQMRTLYDAGFTIVLENIERFVPELRPLCRALEKDLGIAPGKVNVEAFCSPAGGRGHPHFDSSFTFNCQVHGIKKWTLAKNPAIRFPPAGMFLNATPPAEMVELYDAPHPSKIENGQTFLAQSGSVVFVAPGVLHETFMETASFAVAFAVEHTDSIASHVVERVRATLLKIPEVRAARLAAQSRALQPEFTSVAAQLRRLADVIENYQDGWWLENGKKHSIAAGLTIEVTDEKNVVFRGKNSVKAISLDPEMVRILKWVSSRGQFSLREITSDLPSIDPKLAENCIATLTRVGLMETIHDYGD